MSRCSIVQRWIAPCILACAAQAAGCNFQFRLPDTAPTEVGTDGGTVDATAPSITSGDGGSSAADLGDAGLASVTIPPGALPGTIGITVTPWTYAPAPANTTVVGTPVVFEPEGTQFLEPVTVSLPFDPALLPPGTTAAQIQVYTAPLGSVTYTSLGGQVSGPAMVEAQTTHFSVFVPAVPNRP